MIDLKKRVFRISVEVGSPLRPEELSTPELIEAKVEEDISLVLQKHFMFAEVTDTTYEEYIGSLECIELIMNEFTKGKTQYLPEDLL